jgi:hypothetical protein
MTTRQRRENGGQRKGNPTGELTLSEARSGRSSERWWQTTVRDGGATSPWGIRGASGLVVGAPASSGGCDWDEGSEAKRGWTCAETSKGSGRRFRAGAWRGFGRLNVRARRGDGCESERAESLAGGACQALSSGRVDARGKVPTSGAQEVEGEGAHKAEGDSVDKASPPGGES